MSGGPFQRVVDRLDGWIVDRSWRVVATFLVLTALFATGLPAVSTESGTEQFTSGVPAEEALEDVEREFTSPFDADGGTTQLVQSDANVLGENGLLRMLRALERSEARSDLRVESTTSAAEAVALRLDPNATTLDAKVRAVERATVGEIDRAVRAAADDPGFGGLLSTDFNLESASASATIAIVRHALPVGPGSSTGQSATSPLTPIQQRAQFVVGSVGGDVRVFGAGIVAAEFGSVVVDSLLLVVPAAVVLIVFFLIVAYRDPVDLLLGIGALAMTLVWTFGFMGLAGIAFSQFLIAVPPLLLAVGIDFGIHAVNRYREERARGLAVGPAMRLTTDQLLVAFTIVTTTSIIGFMSNYASSLVPIRDFGVVASVGIAFTYFTFGVFLPATKVGIDRLRARYPIPTVSQSPLGSEGSALGRVLYGGVAVARRAPGPFLVVVLLASAGAGVYATGLDTGFSTEDFLPPEETPAYLDDLPEPFAPSEYTITRELNFLERTFEAAEDDSVTVYVEGPMGADYALEAMARAARDPPETFVRDGRVAERQSLVTVVRSYAARDPGFAELVARNDPDGDGVPEDDLGEVYDALLASPAGDAAREYLSEDRRSARIVYTVEADADPADITADARTVAERHRFAAVATGEIVVFQAIAALIFESAVTSLALALAGTAVFLVAVYWLLEGRPMLGVVNLVPIVVTVAMLAGTMRYLGIAFNAFTATVLAITIGLGIDYSVHVVHRFADERREHDLPTALGRTVRGTGGALAGSVLTTVAGIGVLVLAVFPAIGQFGFLTAVSVAYSFLASIVVLPSTLVVWDRFFGPRPGAVPLDAGRGEPASDGGSEVDR